MNLLALDTSTEACSVAVRTADGRVCARFEVVGRDHTKRLRALVDGAMREAGIGYDALDGIACGIGPGSFAGVRIGVAFAQGLALAHGTPALGVSSLALLAQAAVRLHGAGAVAAAIDARMGEVYWGCFAAEDGVAVPLAAPVVIAPDAVDAAPLVRRTWMAAGTGWGVHGTVLAQTTAAVGMSTQTLPELLPDARDAFALVLPAFVAGRGEPAETLAPLYLRNDVALTLVQQMALRARPKPVAGPA